MEELRKVEVFKDNKWKELYFKRLQVGDKYRMIEPDGSPVIGEGKKFEGTTEWVVTKGPYRRPKDEVWTVECEAAGGGVK